MNDYKPPSDELRDLLDDYLSGLLDEPGTARLEQMLLADPAARDYFTRYCRLHTDLHLLARVSKAGQRALNTIGGEQPARRMYRSWRWIAAGAALAACLLVAFTILNWARRDDAKPPQSIAWLVNAQNCQWADDAGLASDFQPGRLLSLAGGLAEIRFAGGASVVIEGPARLELLSAHSARLISGKLAAHVPEPARGFQVHCPQGKIVDLGTEFGMTVGGDGATDVHVFSGKVEAHAGSAAAVGIEERQSAQIAGGAVALRPAGTDPAAAVVRAIAPSPIIVPRSLLLGFDRPIDGSLQDGAGRGTGLTHRLPGTGAELPARDARLNLNTDARRLELITTRSDINTQHQLAQGEYLGIRLADLGFTGSEDFEIAVTLPNIPALHAVGQFGLYAGTRSDQNIRGGLISRSEPGRYGQFLVNNNGGRDSDLNVVGLLSSGDDLHLVLRRREGRYSLSVDNRSTGASSSLTIRHPDFLDNASDLYVGFFAANPQSDSPTPLIINEMKATVWKPSARYAE